jgi:hypothetical protein
VLDFFISYDVRVEDMGSLGRTFGLVIIGGGPAGLATLLAAHKAGRLDALLAHGVAIVETTDHLGAGSIGNYAINSDSGGRTFIDCLDGSHPSPLTQLQDHPLTRQLGEAGDGPVALKDAGRFLGLVGQAIETMIRDHPECALFTRHTALGAYQTVEGWRVDVRDLETGTRRSIMARKLVVASGAHQPAQRLAMEQIGTQTLPERCGERLLQSGEVLTAEGLERINRMLAGKAEPRVAIVGGSTSAAAVAHALLHRLPEVSFGAAGVTLLHRRPLRIYYPGRQEALAENYDEWTEDDVCQVSGRVFRFAGFRLDSRELIMQVRGIGGRPPEPRLRLHLIGADADAVDDIIDRADVVVSAMGYRPRALPLFNWFGAPIPLLSHTGPQQPMVDGSCRILDAQSRPLPNLFGIGLAAGFLPRGRLGGEASFRGQANGLWLWQHDVGNLIVNAVLETADGRESQDDLDHPAVPVLLNTVAHLSAPAMYG